VGHRASSGCEWTRWSPGNCEYIEKAVAGSWKGEVHQIEGWARGLIYLHKKDQHVTECYTGFRITSTGLLWTRLWTFGFYKKLGISWLAEWLLAPQEGLCSIETCTCLARSKNLFNASKIKLWIMRHFTVFPIENRLIIMGVYPKLSRLTTWSGNCKWYSSLPLDAVVSLLVESV
jgi:hypothetical protein